MFSWYKAQALLCTRIMPQMNYKVVKKPFFYFTCKKSRRKALQPVAELHCKIYKYCFTEALVTQVSTAFYRIRGRFILLKKKKSSLLPATHCTCEQWNKFLCFLKSEQICACTFKIMKLVMHRTDLTFASSGCDFLQIKLSIYVALSPCNSCWQNEKIDGLLVACSWPGTVYHDLLHEGFSSKWYFASVYLLEALGLWKQTGWGFGL